MEFTGSQNLLIWGVLLLGIGIALGFFLRWLIAALRLSSLERNLESQTEEAKNKARELILEAKDKAAGLISEIQEEEKKRKTQLEKTEERLLKKEENLEREAQSLKNREGQLEEEFKKTDALKAETARLQKEIKIQLEKTAGLSAEEAKTQLIKQVEEVSRAELANAMARLEKEGAEGLEKKGLELITTVLQRYARSHVAEVTTSVFNLESEDLKGKIIGREGRNIRTLERLTGVEIIVDETPESITISSFDPMRREIAKMALQKLIKDGRIQPARIEEKVEEAKQQLSKRTQEIGEEAAFEVSIIGLPKEIAQLLGRLHFRTSYGQNALVHSIETALIAGMLASELKANVEAAKKAALLHDIGKAISHEVEGTHVELGRKILEKYGIEEVIIKAMEAHHEEYPYSIPESFIVAAADTISTSRPGARRDTVENYIKRMEELEKVASSFEGIKNVYALSAGREIRVFVVPEKIDDFGALQLAKNIAAKIQSELKYPGEVKINVIREMHAVEYAR
jgi:ribonuclease Y